MVGAPATQRRGGLLSGVDEDEDDPAGLQCDRKLQREVVPGLPHRSPIDPQGQESEVDAESLEGPDLLRLGRQPGCSIT